MPYNQAAKITKPSKRSFHFPTFSIPPEFSTVLRFGFLSIASMRNNQIDLKHFETFPQRVAVIPSIGNQAQRPLFRTSSAFARNLYCFERFLGEGDFGGRCRGKGASQRNTLAVDHHHPLCSFPLFGFADAGTPFFAGAKLPSMKASCQSSNPFSSRIERNLRQMSSQTPWSSHSLKRRQQVDGLGYRSGRSCHLAPVRKIHNMPSSTLRLSAAGRPPFGLGFCFGSSGSSFFHCSSFMKRVYSAIGHLQQLNTQKHYKSLVLQPIEYTTYCVIH